MFQKILLIYNPLKFDVPLGVLPGGTMNFLALDPHRTLQRHWIEYGSAHGG